MAVNTFGTLKTAVAAFAKRSDLTSEIPDYIALAEDRIAQMVRIRAMETQGRLIWKATTNVSTVSGTDSITLTPSTAATSYAFADTYAFVAAGTNTGAVTVDVSALGPKDVKKRAGGVVEALSAGDIREGAEYRIYYDGTQFLLSPEGGALLPSDYLALRSRYLDASNPKLEYIAPDRFWQSWASNDIGSPQSITIEGDWVIAAPVPDSTTVSKIDYYRRLAALSSDSDTNWLLTNARGVYLYGALVELAQAKKMHDEALGWSIRFDDLVEDLNNSEKRAQFPPGSAMRSEVPVT